MTTKTAGQRLDQVISSTKQEYDEAKLKIHLTNMEMKEEWDKLEHRWVEFCDNCKSVEEAAKESEGKVVDALHEVGNELRQAFEKIKQACG